MKVLKSNSENSLNLIKGGRSSAKCLDNNEFNLLHEMTNAFQIVYGGQFKSRQHSKLA